MARIVLSLQLARTEDYCYTLHLHLLFHRSIKNFSAYCILRAALFSAALPAERLHLAGSLARTVICLKKLKFGKKSQHLDGQVLTVKWLMPCLVLVGRSFGVRFQRLSIFPPLYPLMSIYTVIIYFSPQTICFLLPLG